MGARITVITRCGSANTNPACTHIRDCATVAIVTRSAVNACLRNQAIPVVVTNCAFGSGVKIIAGESEIGGHTANSAHADILCADRAVKAVYRSIGASSANRIAKIIGAAVAVITEVGSPGAYSAWYASIAEICGAEIAIIAFCIACTLGNR